MNIALPFPNARLMLTACLLALLAQQTAQAQTYMIVELPPLAGDTYSGAFALNESGQAAGFSYNGAVIWTNGVPQNIQTIGTFSVAFAINDLGHAAGDIDPRVDSSGAFYWNGSTMQRIVPPAYEYINEAYAMNNAGTVVGAGGRATFGYRWQGGAFAALGTLSGDYEARPLAINNPGVAAGASIGPNGRRPVIWASTTPQPVIVPSGGSGQGTAWGINDLGLVVGEFYGAGARRPFAWSSGTGAIALPLPTGAATGYAWAVNNAGDIIGDANDQPVLWRKNALGQYVAVLIAEQLANAAEWTQLELYAINEAGQIAGAGDMGGEGRGFILSPQTSSSLSVRWVNRDDPLASWDSAVELLADTPVYAGTRAGDLIACRAVTAHSTADFKWSAQPTDAPSLQGIVGPQGTGATEWRMNQGDFNWPPGSYTVQCQVSQNGSVLETLSVPLTIGWRTDEYLVVGQVKPIDDFTLEADRRDAICTALINSYFERKESYLAITARNNLQLLPLEANLKMWTAFQFLRYAVTDMSEAPPFVRLPGVSTKERFWMVQSLLNEFPDEVNLPPQPELSHLSELRAQKSYRMYGRVQFRYRVAADGAIDPDSVVALRKDSDNGPTKFAQPPELLTPTGKITMRGVEFDLQGNSDQSFISSDPIPNSGSVTLAADHRAFSFYFGGRVGLEGRVPNFALFHKDAPFIFTEMIFAIGPDGRDTDSRIRLSVDKVWSPTGVTGANHFNEIRIYRRAFLPQGVVFQRVDDGEFLISGQLAPFIQSGSSTWPGQPPAPSIE